MSNFDKKTFVLIEDDDDDDDDNDDLVISSPFYSTQGSKLSSLSHKKKTTVSTGSQFQTAKSSQVKNIKSLINSSFPTLKSQKSWISSSFDGFDSLNSLNAIPSKKKKSSKCETFPSTSVNSDQPSNKSLKDEELWIDKYKPNSESELAVHKKKIEEVRSWLLEHLCTKSNAILLLTGPVGAGKTSTLHALSTELGFEIQEWTNPLISTLPEGSDFDSQFFTPKFSSSPSQLVLFQEFLLRANKYPTLSIFGAETVTVQKKIILIEDLPNIFFQDAKKLHEVLTMYKQKGRSPLVLIISDSHRDDYNVHRLLPKNRHSSLGVTTISFNPVAHTSLVKALNRIITQESKKAGKGFYLPTKDTINELSQSSAGDIRTAINALQFCCQKGIQDVSKIPPSKSTSLSGQRRLQEVTTRETSTKKANTKGSQAKKTAGGLSYGKDETHQRNDTLAAIGGKDTTMFLFRALGKILYCKRDSSTSDKDLLPSHMSHLARNLPQFCPEEVVERAHLSSEMLNLYLHQNYLDFFTDIEDVVLASEYLSDSNMMSVEWMHRSSLIPYMSCIATRGLMFSNTHRVGTTSSVGSAAKGGWRPLHKPQWFEVNKKTRDNSQTAKDLFPEQTCPTAVLHTQVLPYLAITDVTLKTPGQISFVQQMGLYQRNKSDFRYSSSTLDEKDCGRDLEQDELTDSQPNTSNSKNSLENDSSKSTIVEQKDMEIDDVEILNTDDDVIIEDFDDEW